MLEWNWGTENWWASPTIFEESENPFVPDIWKNRRDGWERLNRGETYKLAAREEIRPPTKDWLAIGKNDPSSNSSDCMNGAYLCTQGRTFCSNFSKADSDFVVLQWKIPCCICTSKMTKVRYIYCVAPVHIYRTSTDDALYSINVKENLKVGF